MPEKNVNSFFMNISGCRRKTHGKRQKSKTQIFLRILYQFYSHLTAISVYIFSMTLVCKYCFHFFSLKYSPIQPWRDVLLSLMPLISF